MQKLKLFLILLACSTVGCIELIGTLGTIKTDPKLTWKTLETPHFRIHYHDGIADESQKVALYCEEAYVLLTEELHWQPWGKINVVVADIQDRPNAKAVEFPYPQMLILLARPGVNEALQNYDNWLRMVIIHEFTHIVQMDMAGGFWGALRYGFGRVLLPNSMIPGWMSEGYAVFQESDKGKKGRNRSTYVDMVLRMDSLENHFPPIDTLNVRSGLWPYGGQAYFYGGRFFQWLAEKYPDGNQQFSDYYTRYSKHILNLFFLNHHARKIFGKSFPVLYREFQNDLKDRYAKQKEEIEAKGLTNTRRLTTDQEAKTGLLYSPDGEHLLYSHSSGDVRTRFLKVSTKEQPAGKNPVKPEVYHYDFGASDLVWNHDYTKILYSANVNWRDYYNYSRMSAYDFSKKEISTFAFKGGSPQESSMPRNAFAASRRMMNPHSSPSGTDFVFVYREAGTENLWRATLDEQGEYEWNKKKFKLIALTQAPAGTEFNYPRFSPCGEKIAVSTFDPVSMQRNIVLYEKDGKFIRKVTEDDFQNETPFWGLDSNELFFVSDRSGVSNIYSFNLKTKKHVQVTNVLGGTFSPTLSPDGKRLAFLGYHARGFDVYEMDLEEKQLDPSNDEVETAVQPAPPDKGYTPFPELFVPRFLSPYFQIVDDDDFYIGASTGSTDALRKHVWRADGYYRTKVNSPGGRLSYIFAGWYPEMFVTLSANPIAQNGTLLAQSPLTGTVFGVRGQFEDNILVQRDMIAKTGLSMKIPIQRIPGMAWTPGTHRLTGGYEFIHRENVSDINPLFVQFTGAPLPTMVFVPTEYKASGIFLDYSYDSTVQRRRGISPSGEVNQLRDFLRGYSLSIGYEFFDDALGGNLNQQVLTADFRSYRRIPFTNHHVLALRGVGGFSFGDDTNPETFSLGGSFSEGIRNSTTRNFYPLRGFGGGARRGEQMFMLSGEYRFPIWIPERGISTLPIFVKNIHGAFFSDYGDARDRFFAQNDSIVFDRGLMGVGAEVRSEFTLFYNARFDARLGYGIPVLNNQNFFFDFGDGELILNLGTTF